MEPISVLIVDDSALMRTLIRRMLEADDGIRVAGVAMNGQFALHKTVSLKPDVIILDLMMPELDGLGYLKKRQENGWEVPVVILSAVAKKGAEVTMKALSLGASDFITKPTGSSPDENEATAEQLIGMVRAYGRSYRRKKSGADIEPLPPPKPVLPPARGNLWPKITPKRGSAPPKIAVIGISTGGPNALRQIFPHISPNLHVPIIVVQHMPPGFTAEFANSLNKICPLEVKEASDGDIVAPGRILIAPGDRHVKVEKKQLATIAKLDDGENVNGHKPSVGVLFDSVAAQYGNATMGIIMTGMGRDGSREIGGIYEEGGICIAQDEESSVVFGMPRVAIEHGYVNQVLALEEMADAINELGGALD